MKYSQVADFHIIKIVDWGIGVEYGIQSKMFELYSEQLGEDAVSQIIS